MKVSTAVIAQSDEMGALPTLYAATQPGLEGGTYVGPDGFQEQRGHPKIVQPAGGPRPGDRTPALGGQRANDGGRQPRIILRISRTATGSVVRS